MTRDEFEEAFTKMLSEAMADGYINDAVVIAETDDGLLSLGTIKDPDEDIPKNSLRVVAHWMYHVASGHPSHKRIHVVKIQRKGKAGRTYNA